MRKRTREREEENERDRETVNKEKSELINLNDYALGLDYLFGSLFFTCMSQSSSFYLALFASRVDFLFIGWV